ncbi:MAG: site-specific integrase [Acidobacteria bacterium]|nr:site-specific integrase [Acidobacteriota bacterium]
MVNRRPKGTGNIRERDGRHQATYSYTDDAGKRRLRSATFDTRTEARKWLNKRLAEVASGRVSDSGGLTVGEYLQDWLGSLGMSQLEANTVAWYRSATTCHIIPALGGVKLSRLSAVQIEAFLAEKADHGRLDGTGGLGPASVRRLQVTLHKALDAAVRKGMLATNPVDFADKPKMPPRDVTENVWTPEETTTFLETTKTDRLAPLWRTATMTGLRRSELAGLQWGDLDLERSVLSVKRARTQVEGKPVVKAPKSAASRRIVDLDTETVAVLKRWKVAQLEERLRAGTAWEPGEWVFADEVGTPWRPDALTRAFQNAAEAGGLPPTDIKGLRHAHATALLSTGVHPKVVQERLGHSSISITMDIYSSVLPGMQREAVELLASMMKPGNGLIDGG